MAADPKPTQPTPPATVQKAVNLPRDRTRDVESLAADIFARRAGVLRGNYTFDHLILESLAAAREFYRIADAPPEPMGEHGDEPSPVPG